MSMGFSQWSMQKKLAIFDEQLHAVDFLAAPTNSTSNGVTLNTVTDVVPPQGMGIASAVAGACAVVGCGVASTLAYASYAKWKRKEKIAPVDEEKECVKPAGRVNEIFSNLRTAYNTFTSRERVTPKQHTTATNVHEGHREILAKHKKLLTALKNNFTKAGIDFGEEETNLLNTTVDQLSEKFLISVVGEFNAGKSAFINSLLGGKFVQEGILPTTDFITKITYDEHESCTRNSAQNLMEVKLPVPWLKEVTIVDTPGTNALFELGHQAITERFLPHSDLVLFVTSAERPLTESERQIIKRIREWNRRIVVVVNKCDLRTEEEKQDVIAYIRDNLEDICPGNDIPIFGISARLALMSKIQAYYQEDTERAPWQDIWMASNIGAVERFMFHSLDDAQKMRVKLQGPLAVASRFLALYDAKLKEGEARLQQEQALLSSVDSLIETHFMELMRDFKNVHVDQLDRSYSRLREGTSDFVDHHISFGSFAHFLMHPKAMQGTFREEVCQNFQSEVEGSAIKLTDWLTEVRSRMVEKVLQEMNSVSNRSTTVLNVWKNIRVAPVVIGQDHQLELRQFRETVQGIIEKFTSDEKHSRALIDSVQTSITQILAVEGLAGIMGAMWYSSFWIWLQQRNSSAERLLSFISGPDTSIARELAKPIPLLFLAAGTVLMGLSGMNILQYRRNAVKRKLAREADLCQTNLVGKLDTFVQEKARKTVADTTEWLKPFLQAIKAENDRIEEMKSLVSQWHEEVEVIASQIDDVTEQLAQPVMEEGEIYPVSKPMAYPTATPLGPAPRGLQQTSRRSFVAPPSYANEAYAAPSCYPSIDRTSSLGYPQLERSSSLRSPTNNFYSTSPMHFNYPPSQQQQAFNMSSPYRQVTPPVTPTNMQRPVQLQPQQQQQQSKSSVQQQQQPIKTTSSPPVTTSSSPVSSPVQSDDEVEAERAVNKRAIAILA